MGTWVPVTKVALVLGAGGLVGQAYHAGVLAALEHELGWDARGADVVVGTSAGSLTGALLRAGVGAEDIARHVVEAPETPSLRRLHELVGEPPVLAPPRPLDLLRPMRPPPPAFLLRQVRDPRSWRFTSALSVVAPRGRVPLARHLAVLERLVGPGWPERDLLVCALRCSDGRRVVFGDEGAPEVPVHVAVAASCAIPGYFEPVRIAGVDHVDGGGHSPTNADVLAGRGIDLVVVSSAMSAAPGGWPTPDGVLRRHFHRRLRHEAARLRAEGTAVVRLEPSGEVLRAMGSSARAMDDAHKVDVVREAFLATGQRLAEPAVAERLRPLARRRPAA